MLCIIISPQSMKKGEKNLGWKSRHVGKGPGGNAICKHLNSRLQSADAAEGIIKFLKWLREQVRMRGPEKAPAVVVLCGLNYRVFCRADVIGIAIRPQMAILQC